MFSIPVLRANRSKTLISLTLVISTLCSSHAVAQKTFPVVLHETKDEKGRSVQFVIDSSTMANLPTWTPVGGDPPVSLSAATKIAYAECKRQSPKSTGASIREIRLVEKV